MPLQLNRSGSGPTGKIELDNQQQQPAQAEPDLSLLPTNSHYVVIEHTLSNQYEDLLLVIVFCLLLLIFATWARWYYMRLRQLHARQVQEELEATRPVLERWLALARLQQAAVNARQRHLEGNS